MAESKNKPEPVEPDKSKAPVEKEPDGIFAKLKFPELPARQAIGIPLAILVIALLITGYTLLTIGSPLHLGLDFKGGTLITLKTDKTDSQLQNEFSKYPLSLITRDP